MKPVLEFYQETYKRLRKNKKAVNRAAMRKYLIKAGYYEFNMNNFKSYKIKYESIVKYQQWLTEHYPNDYYYCYSYGYDSFFFTDTKIATLMKLSVE